jgi:hypothetical protein
MSRAIDLYALTCEPDGTVGRYWLSYRAAAVMGWTFSNRYEALIASGAGMDMGFHAVYSLSSRLYPDGFDCTGERCPSSDHSNGMPRPLITAAEAASMIGKAPVPHHASGGYALRQAWL